MNLKKTGLVKINKIKVGATYTLVNRLFPGDDLVRMVVTALWNDMVYYRYVTGLKWGAERGVCSIARFKDACMKRIRRVK